jgi:predicted GNAT family acetyltransferase
MNPPLARSDELSTVARTIPNTVPNTVADDPEAHRYELLVDGQVAALANYSITPGKIVFLYTELLPGFEGRGLGQQLANAVLDDVRRRGLVVGARCPFFSTFIEDNPSYGDLVDPPLTRPMPTLRVAAE